MGTKHIKTNIWAMLIPLSYNRTNIQNITQQPQHDNNPKPFTRGMRFLGGGRQQVVGVTRTWQVIGVTGRAWWVGQLTRTWQMARVKGRAWWVGQLTRTWQVARIRGGAWWVGSRWNEGEDNGHVKCRRQQSRRG